MKTLSKSQYTRGMQCAKSLWLYRERKDLRDPVTPDQQRMFDTGNEVGELARQRFATPRSVLITEDHTQPEAALEATTKAIRDGKDVIFEAAFLHDEVVVRVDVLRRNSEATWDIIEVKATSEVKGYHLTDVAVQRYVIAGDKTRGVQIARAHLAHLDPNYKRGADLRLDLLFQVEDVTELSADALAAVPANLAYMKKIAAGAEAPEVKIGGHCKKPNPCDFRGFCWDGVPEYSVWDLSGARDEKKTELWNKGVKTVAAVSASEKLTSYQKVQRDVAVSGKPHVNEVGIREFLKTLEWPRRFLDFEAINAAVPRLDGTRPFEAVPFQASVRVQPEPGAPLAHHEFLDDGRGDPRGPLARFLVDSLGQKGSVIAFHAPYEKGILNGLSASSAIPAGLGRPIAALAERLRDLADPFRKANYHHPAQEGSWSIKAVLPVLAPGHGYEGLAIKDGAAAMAAYERLVTDKALTEAERAQIMDDLKVYCGQDTEGMVLILDFLEQLVGAGAAR